MGGLCFRNKLGLEGKRLSKDDYFNVAAEVIHKITKIFHRNHLVRAYYKKQDYGDQDWICSSPIVTSSNIKNQILEHFNIPLEFLHQNTSVYSILYKEFQIDFSVIPERFFETSCFYMDDSPSGNAIGKLYHKFGASYGYNGLYYTLRDNFNTYKLGEIEISTDNNKIYEFLGLDFSQKVKGFETENDIFDFIASSKMFDHRIFAFDQMNHRARVRDKKRPDYNRLMSYIDEKYKNSNYDFPIKSDGVNILNEFFPESHLLDKIQELKNKESKRRELSKKFNGNLVMDWYPGLKGLKLGTLMGEFKQYQYKAGFTNFGDYLDQNTEEKVKKDFEHWMAEIKVYKNEDDES